MTSKADWEEVERLFHQTVDLRRDARPALLAAASPSIRAEVESLLKAECGADFLLPPVHLAADLLDSQPAALSCGDVVGGYEIEVLIARGGMGEVYRARDCSGKQVALKMLRRHLILSPQAIDRFETEARAASALCDPNIVSVFSSGDSPAGLFLAMEWIEGQTFRQLLCGRKAETADAIQWSLQASSALAAAHAAGVLHRDIKPENIIVRSDGLLKILDFGLARLAGPVRIEPDTIGSSGTISGTLSGTLLYMSPEILLGETATSASDVFSLGTLLYELWTGKHPFAGETPLDVFEAIECRSVDRPSSLQAGVPPEVDSIIFSMIERDPLLRPSAHAAAQVFSRFSAKP